MEDYRPSRRDAGYLLVLLVLLCMTGLCAEAMDRPAVLAVGKMEARGTGVLSLSPLRRTAPSSEGSGDGYGEDVPLALELQGALYEACAGYGVPVHIALAVMERESGFLVDAVGADGHDIGLFQIRTSNHRWLREETGADPMTPEGNVACGVWFLSYLYDYCGGDWGAALTAYRWGPGHGETSEYAEAVLARAEEWR